ncbi:MAG: hypothetical protein ACRETE_07590 [Stenotrophobium sp.]
MILYKELSWWYWALTAMLLIVGLAGWFEAFHIAVALSAVQIVHFSLREGSFAAFPVQVRVVYTAILLAASWPPMNWLYWAPAIGTAAQVLFGYCFLARCLSLLPWNRREPICWRLVWRTFASPPVKGSVMQGLPAMDMKGGAS